MHDRYVRTYEFPNVWVHEHEQYIHTVHRDDGASSTFAPPVDPNGKTQETFVAAAHEMGYSDPFRYAVEHEIAHQFIAMQRGLTCSLVVWQDAHGVPQSIEDPDTAAEEHLVNCLQRFCNLGIPDAYGCLQSVFGAGLGVQAHLFLMMARPWMS